MQNNHKRKTVSFQMLGFEFRKVIGNPYVHIFGVGMPVLMMIIITRAVMSQVAGRAMLEEANTSVFLGIGALIPMATIFMGSTLFGIRAGVSICNRILSEIIFMILAFLVYFGVGYAAVDLKAPTLSGGLLYLVCIFSFSVILFCLSHAISSLLRKFSLTYCVTMLLYFGMMVLSGMMGISYDNMPLAVQTVAKLLPVTYINRDFYIVWKGESYNFVPMLQSYLLMAAIAGIAIVFTIKRTERKLH